MLEKISFEIFLLFVLFVINGLFSMSEIAVVSARRVRLQKMANEGNRGAQTALELGDAPDRFLSTVQIGITLVGVLSGAFGGAALAVHLKPFIEKIAFLAAYAESVSFFLVVAVITYFSLVVGELVPKRLGLNAPEKIAALVSRPLNFLSRVTSPLVRFLSFSTALILKIFRQNKPPEAAVSEEEIRAVILQGATDGILQQTEHQLLESVIRLDDKKITALMTPRTKIVWLDISAGEDEIRRTVQTSPFSRILVGEGSLDNLRGFVKAKDLLGVLLAENRFALETAVKQPIFVPETVTALDLLEKFRDADSHLAVIIDEFGATEGIVTTNDILEEIIGELSINGVHRASSAVQREDGSWLLDGQLPVADFCRLLGIVNLPAGEIGKYHTLAGFVIKRLNKIPAVGDKFVWRKTVFEVVDMDGNRIDRILVTEKL